jgi:hypothetical protein
LWRNLREAVDQLVVSEPRRNRLIAKDGDKDDDLDAEKLAQLLRGGYVKAVYQVQTLVRALLCVVQSALWAFSRKERWSGKSRYHMCAKIVAKSVSQGRSCNDEVSGIANSLAKPQLRRRWLYSGLHQRRLHRWLHSIAVY